MLFVGTTFYYGYRAVDTVHAVDNGLLPNPLL